MLQHVSVSTGDELHGSRVSRARPHGTPGQAGAPFDYYRHTTEEGGETESPSFADGLQSFLHNLTPLNRGRHAHHRHEILRRRQSLLRGRTYQRRGTEHSLRHSSRDSHGYRRTRVPRSEYIWANKSPTQRDSTTGRHRAARYSPRNPRPNI